MNYRFDINALRAFSIIFVVLYHFKVPFFNGGFIGVDVFFVISGYLMTKVIFHRLTNHTFRLSDFYIDRAFRIIPALTFVCISYLIIGWLLLYPLEYKQLAKEIVAAITFSSNFLYFEQSGYFDPTAEKLFLLHTWSLAVEWQFYIVYPIVIILLAKLFRLNQVKYILAALCFASWLSAIILVQTAPTFSFYLLPTRAWEMLIGGLIFLFPIAIQEEKRKYVQLSALLGLLGSVVLLNSKMAWPGLFTLFPVLSACLFIIANSQNTAISNNSTLSFLGKSSYSIYLWHWPIYVLRDHLGLSDRTLVICMAISLSVALGYLSFRAIETYFISFKKENIHNRKRIIFALSLLLAIIFPSIFIYAYKGDEKTLFLTYYANMHKNGLNKAYRLECDFYDNTTQKARQSIAKECTAAHPDSAHKDQAAFLWGDSHAQALSSGLSAELPDNYALYQVATSGCPPSLTINPRSGKIDNHCQHSNEFALAEISRLKPDIVFLAQVNFHEEVDWLALATNLKTRGVKQVVLIGPVPQFNPSLPEVYVKYNWRNQSSYLSEGLDQSVMNTNRILIQKYSNSSTHPLLTFVPLIPSLCVQDRCKVVIDGTKNSLLLVDFSHLTPLGSLVAGKIILKNLQLTPPEINDTH